MITVNTQFKHFLSIIDNLIARSDKMKINASDYQAKDIIRIIREWTELNQKKFGETIKKTRDSINNYENGRNRIYLNDFLEMCKIHNIKITIEKK